MKWSYVSDIEEKFLCIVLSLSKETDSGITGATVTLRYCHTPTLLYYLCGTAKLLNC